jgi:hypothetical protein
MPLNGISCEQGEQGTSDRLVIRGYAGVGWVSGKASYFLHKNFPVSPSPIPTHGIMASTARLPLSQLVGVFIKHKTQLQCSSITIHEVLSIITDLGENGVLHSPPP